MEVSLWRPDTQLLSAGVLTQRPLEGAGPWPTLVVNLGSTGNGDRPAMFGVPFVAMDLVRYFTQRGWQVLFPQRRGRGSTRRRRWA